VRAAEVEFQAIGAGIFSTRYDLVPCFPLRLHHQRRNDCVAGVALLHLSHLAEICIYAAVADELDIVEAHDALAVPVGGRVA
jgi:hypothetical protein